MREKYKKMYEELKSGEKDKRLEELKNKIVEKTATQQEYKEAKRIEKGKENLEKVESVMKLQEKIDAEASKVIGTINRINSKNKITEELDKKLVELEEELAKIEEEKSKIQEELKTATGENKAVLTLKLRETNTKIGENNSKYQKALQDKLNIQNTKDVEIEKYGQMTMEELDEKQNDLRNKSARCDLVIVNLLKGRNLDDISVQLDNYQKRTFKSDEKLSNRKVRKEEKTKETSPEIPDEELEEIEKGLEKETKKIVNEAKKETALTTEPEFAKKHPRLAKIGNWFKNIFSKKEKSGQAVMENAIEKETNIEKEPKVEKNVNKDKAIEDIVNSNENDFKKYLKDITKNGYDKTVEEKAMEDIERRKEKLKQAKEQAYDREVAKLGKDYAEKSYHKDEEIEK